MNPVSEDPGTVQPSILCLTHESPPIYRPDAAEYYVSLPKRVPRKPLCVVIGNAWQILVQDTVIT